MKLSTLVKSVAAVGALAGLAYVVNKLGDSGGLPVCVPVAPENVGAPFVDAEFTDVTPAPEA
jgi:hypothetical protein